MANTTNKKPSAKASNNKKNQIQPKTHNVMGYQKISIILGALSAFTLALVFIPGESIWNAIHKGMFGLFGFCAYFVPLILGYLSFISAKYNSLQSVAGNLISAGIFTLILSSAIHIFSNTAEYLRDTGLSIQIGEAWNSESKFGNGGVIGSILGGLLSKMFGRTGASITSVILLIVLVMLLTGTTIFGVFSALRNPVKKVGQFTNERLEKNAQLIEEQRAKWEEEKAERIRIKEQQTISKVPVIDQTETRLEPDPIPKLDLPPVPIDDDVVVPKRIGNDTIEIPIVNLGQTENKSFPELPDDITDIDDINENLADIPVVEESEKIEKPKKIRRKRITETVIEDNDNEEVQTENNAAYVLPPIDCLKKPEGGTQGDSMTEMQMSANKLLATLDSFKIKAEITNIVRGPSVTRYELVPDAGVRINKITSLTDDIALRMAAKSIRIEAPIPGKSAIGIEVPNSNKSMVTMREIIDTPTYRESKSKLNVALGKDITGNIICTDLTKMPHLLVAGTTGSGKSVCLNSMIISILYNATPDEVKFLMIDPKMVEFTIYNGIAHLEVPVVSNPRKAAGALAWAVSEMEKRYKAFSENSVRDIKGFNALADTRDDLVKMHHIVIFIDELSDLMMASPKEVEDSICRLAQMARAAGIHLVIATQRPSVDVITGIIKANIPSRIALYVSSQVDSRTILDQGGAEKLLGNGDMLFNPVGASKPLRVQGCYISDQEVENVVNHVKSQVKSTYNDETMRQIEEKAAMAEKSASKNSMDEDGESEYDPMINNAIEVVVTAGQASTTMLQKKLKLGYARASRVMDQLEELGIVGPSEGAKPREVKMTKQEWYERQALSDPVVKDDGPVQYEFDDVLSDDDDDESNDLFDEIDNEEEF